MKRLMTVLIDLEKFWGHALAWQNFGELTILTVLPYY
jgi:hypothetical protein